jgi:hypothetical protein
MYIGAALSLWMVRAWKIGEMEEKAAIEGKSEGGQIGVAPEGFKRSAFIKRMIMLRRV